SASGWAKIIELVSCRVRGGVRKAGRRSASVVAHGHDAKERAHLVWLDQARQCRVDGDLFRLAGARFQRGGALPGADAAQEIALRDRAEGRHAGRSGERREIDMGAQVRLAGPLEDGGAALFAYGLQGSAAAGAFVAVVDDQRPAALPAQARADGAGNRAGRFGNLRLRSG